MGLQKVQANFRFRLARCAPKQNAIRLLNPRGVTGFVVHSLGERLGLLINKTAVHKIQALQRDVGSEALLGGEGRIGIIEHLQEIVQPVTANLAEHGAAIVVVGKIGGWSADLLQIQGSRDEE